MIQTQSLRRRSWAGIAGLIVIGVAVLIALALGNTIALLVTLAAAALAGLLVLRERTAVPAQTPVAATPARVSMEPHAQRAVLAADGRIRQALVVPAASSDGYQTVLTVDGYALINAEGRVVYALNRELRASSSEPVVVTILDAEAESNEPVMVNIPDSEAVTAS